MQKPQEDGKTSHVHRWTSRVNIVKTAIYRATFRFNILHRHSRVILRANRNKKDQKTEMETPTILNSQSNPEQREQRGRYRKLYIQVILQSYSSRNSRAPSQTQTGQQTQDLNKPLSSSHLMFEEGATNLR